MKTSRGLLIGVVLLAALAGVVYWSNKSEAAKEAAAATEKSKDAPPKLITIADDQVKQVQLKKKDAEPTVLEKDSSGKWRMQGPKQYAVDQDAASGLVSTVTGLTWDRLVEEKGGDLTAFGLNQPQDEISVSGKDGKSQKLLIGDDTPTSGTVYAKLDGDPRVFTLVTSAKNSLEKTPDDLRDKRLLTFDADKVSRIEFTGSDKERRPQFELGKNNQGEWQIVKPKPYRADGFQVEELLRHLREARMDNATGKPDPKLIGGGIATVKVTDASGTQQIEVKKNYKENIYFAKSSTVPGLHKLPGDIGQGFEKNLDSFRNKKLLDFGFNELSKVEIRIGSNTIVLQKSGSDWKKDGQTMDAVSVQSVIDKLRDLNATGFEEKSRPATTDVDIRVYWAAGKRTEHVTMGKAGEGYLAQRENEPAIYVAGGAVVDGLQTAIKDLKPAQAQKK